MDVTRSGLVTSPFSLSSTVFSTSTKSTEPVRRVHFSLSITLASSIRRSLRSIWATVCHADSVTARGPNSCSAHFAVSIALFSVLLSAGFDRMSPSRTANAGRSEMNPDTLTGFGVFDAPPDCCVFWVPGCCVFWAPGFGVFEAPPGFCVFGVPDLGIFWALGTSRVGQSPVSLYSLNI